MAHTKNINHTKIFFLSLVLLMVCCCLCKKGINDKQKIINVSSDITRELFIDYNNCFAKYWKQTTGEDVVVYQSHGPSTRQAQAVLQGLAADVVVLASPLAVDRICDSGSIVSRWDTRLPRHSMPFSSAVVFLVRKGNPRQIFNWNDCVRSDVVPITASPQSSGAAQWIYCAAWSYGQGRNTADSGFAFVSRLYKKVRVLDAGLRESATMFAGRGFGDVLITWESEALRLLQGDGAEIFDLVVPSTTFATGISVSMVDKNILLHKNRQLVQAYCYYMYSDEAQRLCVQHGFRPCLDSVYRTDRGRFFAQAMVNVHDIMGTWSKIGRTHFADSGYYHQIFVPLKKDSTHADSTKRTSLPKRR